MRETIAERPAAIHHQPAPIREERGYAPSEGMNWVPGHWKWEDRDWVWVHGKWVSQPVPPTPPLIVEQITVAPSPQHFWVPGHWVWRFDGHGGWIWVHGGWHQ